MSLLPARTTRAPLAPAAAPGDRELVARVRAGDRRAFEMVFDAHAAALVAFARAEVGSTAVAEEIVQEIFFTIWLARERWVVRRSVRAYLCQAVHNRALNHHRDTRADRLRLEPLDTSDAVEQCEARERADDRLTDAELRQAIDRAVATLPEKNRSVFHLVRRHQLTYREVADVLGISVKSVEAHMHRAVRALHDTLNDWLR